MTAYVLTDEQDVVRSIGTAESLNLPVGWTAYEISDADFALIRTGYKRWVAGSVVDTNLAAQAANTADLNAKLATLLTEATAAIDSLQTIRDRTDLAAGTLTTAVLSTPARQLQTDSKTEARLLQETMKRVVAIARLTTGAIDVVDNT
jgi:hypothetical protein